MNKFDPKDLLSKIGENLDEFSRALLPDDYFRTRGVVDPEISSVASAARLLIKTLILVQPSTVASDGGAFPSLENRSAVIKQFKQELVKRDTCKGSICMAKTNYNFLLSEYNNRTLILDENTRSGYIEEAVKPLHEAFEWKSRVPDVVWARVQETVSFLGGPPLRFDRAGETFNNLNQLTY